MRLPKYQKTTNRVKLIRPYDTEENTLRLCICIWEKVVITFVPIVTVSFTALVKREWGRMEVQ